MFEDAWVRVDADGWDLVSVEPSGTSEATWLREPGTDHSWLHKDTKIPSNGIEQGEDWSEVISTQVGMLLGVPCAATQLCMRSGHRGTLSRSVRPKTHDLWEGAVVLVTANVEGYFPHVEGEPPAADPARPGVRRPGHTLENIRAVLAGTEVPPGFQGPAAMTGFDVFAGYMLFDALIANPDRHEQNWAKLVPALADSTERLCPSYDHASSLGHNLQDTTRTGLLGRSDGLATWVTKGRAMRYEHSGKARTLVDHAVKAIQMGSKEGAHWWSQQIHTLDLDPLIDQVNGGAIPEMSAVASTFATTVLNTNLRRLRDAINRP